MPPGLGVHWERMRLLPKNSKEIAICAFYKKKFYRRTFTEDRPHLAEVFLAIIDWFSSAGNI